MFDDIANEYQRNQAIRAHYYSIGQGRLYEEAIAGFGGDADQRRRFEASI